MKNMVAAMEFGTSKLVALVAETSGRQRCDIIGAGTVVYDGYMDGRWNAPGALNEAIAAEPDNPTYLDTYAWILHLLGQDIEAKAIFKHAMLYGGKDSRTILEHYAIVLETLGEKDLANIYYKQAAAMTADE